MRSQPRTASGFSHVNFSLLNLRQNTLLELPLHLLTLVIRPRLTVESHQGTQVELWGLQELDLADVYLEWRSD